DPGLGVCRGERRSASLIAGHVAGETAHTTRGRRASRRPRAGEKLEGGRMFRKLGVILGVALLFASAGCIADHKFGWENTTLVPSGSPEGEIFAAHGCPDQVIEIGNAVGPNIRHWEKYLVVYRIGEGHMLLGNITQRDKFANIAYLVDAGKVMQGGFVG